MTRKNCLVKISGDMILTKKVFLWIKKRSKKYFVVVCVGGGTQINEAFAKEGLPIRKHGPLGREAQSLVEMQLARDVLEENKEYVQDSLVKIGVFIGVEIPYRTIGTVLCPENGDQYVLSAYNGFDLIRVITTKERKKAKALFFSSYPKIKVIGL